MLFSCLSLSLYYFISKDTCISRFQFKFYHSFYTSTPICMSFSNSLIYIISLPSVYSSFFLFFSFLQLLFSLSLFAIQFCVYNFYNVLYFLSYTFSLNYIHTFSKSLLQCTRDILFQNFY